MKEKTINKFAIVIKRDGIRKVKKISSKMNEAIRLFQFYVFETC